MRILSKLLLIASLSFASAYSESLNIEEQTLDNGLRVIVLSTKAPGVVFCGVGYFVGSADDPRNVVGISHVLEHMMFKGTKSISGEDLKKIVFIYNKASNAFTSYDITVYVHLASKSFLDADLQIEADRMRNLKLSAEDLAREKEVIIEERKMRTESDPITNFMEEAAFKVMYLFSNYSYPVIGYLDQIKACNEKEVKNHYEKFYKPNNAFVLLVGDISMQEALKKVKKHFGNIKKGEESVRNRVIDPEDIGIKYTLEREAQNISVNNLNIIYQVNRPLFDDLKKLVTLEIAAGILGSGTSSVLYKNIVDKEKLAYGVDSLLSVRAFDKGRVNITTVFKENQTLETVENEIQTLVNDYADKHLTDVLVEKEKQKITDQIEKLSDNPQEFGMFILTYLINGYNLEDVNRIKKIVKSITFEDVKAMAKQVFSNKNRMMRIYSHPKKD